jgi:hypothetical protein
MIARCRKRDRRFPEVNRRRRVRQLVIAEIFCSAQP